MTRTAPRGASAVAHAPWSFRPSAPGKLMAAVGNDGGSSTTGAADALGCADAEGGDGADVALGALVEEEAVDELETVLEQEERSAVAALASSPRSASRRNASRLVTCPSAKSVPISSAR